MIRCDISFWFHCFLYLLNAALRVENSGEVGIYRTFWALLDKDDPMKIVHLADTDPLLEANSTITEKLAHQIYLGNVVFTTGIAEHGEDYIIASGELDLACRITRIAKKYFTLSPL